MTHQNAILGKLSVALLVAGLVGAGPQAVAEDRRSYTGTIDGADFRVELPEHWNGTLVLYSHGYFPPGFQPPEIMLANRPDTVTWLLEHGYALAASNYRGVTGAVYEQAPRDQLALLDWFNANIGRPERTVATGSSYGAVLAIMLAERNPHRFAGVLGMCGTLDLSASWNLSLDITFAIKTLLAPDQDIDLVRPRDAAGSAQALQQAVNNAVTSPQGTARLALANAFGNITGWNSAIEPRPTGLTEQLAALAQVDEVFTQVFGPTARPDLERRAGGNPSWNVGVDYRHQLARSAQRDLVRQAYREAGLDLDADLDLLATAPRIAPDPDAVGWLHRFGALRGTTPTPVVTMHSVADPAAADHERWYAGQVRHNGDPNRLRQLYTDRATHCAFTAAEEIVALRTVITRAETGRWPDTSPRTLNTAASSMPDQYQLIHDFPTNQEAAVPPAFIRFTPPHPLRPSR